MKPRKLLLTWIGWLVIVLVLTACGSSAPEGTQIPPTEPATPPTETTVPPTATIVQSTESAPPEDSATEAVSPTVEPAAEAEVAAAYLKYDIGDAVFDLAVADLNGDALPDIAAPDHISGLTTILMNDGHGAFQEAGSYNTGESSSGVSAADFNGDSYLDLAISQEDTETISILINEGAGTFQAPVLYAAGPTPVYVQSGDMNGDSFIDLVVIHEPDLVGLLFNNGDGTFAKIVQYFVGSRAGYGSAHPVDVDGDGHLDVAVRHMPDALVSILMNQGDGTMAEPIEYEACINAMSSNFPHPWLTTGDLNQDGAPDLLIPCDSGIVSILLNSGDGSFQETIHLESGGSTKDVKLAELNGDDLPDLLVAPTGAGLMSSYANLGDGAFQPLKDYPYTDYDIYGIDELNIVDVEGDGLLDVIGQGGGSMVYVLPIEGDGTATEPPATHQTYDIGDEIWGLAVADLNGDAHLDIAASDEGSESVRILFNNGDGTFQQVAEITTGEANSVAAVDLDGDTDIDLAVANGKSGTVSLLFNNGDGSFQAPVDYAAEPEPNWVIAEDLNGDSHFDLVVPQTFGDVGVFLNNGDGTLGDGQWFFTGSNGRGISASADDLNGDTYPDLAVRHYPDPVVSILLNDGDGSFGEAVEYEVLRGPHWLTTADVNVDGYPDVIVPSQQGAVSVLLNNGDGSLQDRMDIEVGGEPYYIEALDMDGDSVLDLLVGPTGSGMVSLLSNNGDGSFELTKDYYYPGAWAYIFIATDVDGDDRVDLVATSLDSSIFVIPIEIGD